MFKKNVSLHFEGVVECAICYRCAEQALSDRNMLMAVSFRSLTEHCRPSLVGRVKTVSTLRACTNGSTRRTLPVVQCVERYSRRRIT